MTLQIQGQPSEPVQWGGITYQRVRGVFVGDDVELIRSSDFGIFRPQFNNAYHTGQDLAGSMGEPGIWDAPDGVGIFSGPNFAGLGNALGVLCEDDEGVEWLIAIGHLRDRPLIARGESIRRGQRFGYMGSTGQSTGPHFHIATALALDYDAAPGVSESDEEGDYIEFWNSPRDDDGGVSRLKGILDYLVDEVSPDLLPLWNPLPVPGQGDMTLTVTRRSVGLLDLERIAHGDGIQSLWAPRNGVLVGLITGAPPFVDAPFAEVVLDEDDQVPVGTVLIAMS